MHEREIALEATRVEVVVEPHDDERVVDIADDRMTTTFAVATGDVRCRRHARVHAAGIAVVDGEDPVADGERRRIVEAVAQQTREHARRSLGVAVVQAQRVAVHGGDAQQLRLSAGWEIAASGTGPIGEPVSEADALQA